MSGTVFNNLELEILESLPIPIAVYDTEHNLLWANRAYQEAAGLSKGDVGGKKCWIARVSKEPCENCPVTSALQTGLPAEVEFTPPLTEDGQGTRGKWLVKVVPLIDKTGSITAAIETVCEMRSQKDTVEEVSGEAEENFETLAQSARDAIIIIDATGRVIYWNPAAERIFGYSCSEMMGQDVHEVLVPEELREQAREGFETFRKTGDGPVVGKVVELTAKHKSGALIPIEICVSPVQKHGTPCVLGIIRDIRERKNAEKALVESQKRFEQLSVLLNDVVWVAHADGSGLIDITPSCENLYGVPRERFFAKPDLWLEMVHPLDRHIAQASAEELFQKGKSEAEYRIVRSDGSVRWVLDRRSLLPNEPGDSKLIAGITTDITERKELQEKLQHQLEFVSWLYRAAEKLVEDFSLVEQARFACRAAVEAFGLTLAWLGKAEKDGSITLLAQYPEDISYPREIRVRWDESPEGQGPTGRAIRSGSPQVTEDISKDPRFSPWQDHALKSGKIASAGAFPLIARGNTFGTLNLYSDQIGVFAKERILQIQSFAHLAATALENARLYEESCSRIERITALRNIDLAITGSLDLRMVTKVALEEIRRQLHIDAASILVLDPFTQTLQYLDATGFDSKRISLTRIPLGRGVTGRAPLEKK